MNHRFRAFEKSGYEKSSVLSLAAPGPPLCLRCARSLLSILSLALCSAKRSLLPLALLSLRLGDSEVIETWDRAVGIGGRPLIADGAVMFGSFCMTSS